MGHRFLNRVEQRGASMRDEGRRYQRRLQCRLVDAPLIVLFQISSHIESLYIKWAEDVHSFGSTHHIIKASSSQNESNSYKFQMKEIDVDARNNKSYWGQKSRLAGNRICEEVAIRMEAAQQQRRSQRWGQWPSTGSGWTSSNPDCGLEDQQRFRIRIWNRSCWHHTAEKLDKRHCKNNTESMLRTWSRSYPSLW